MSYFKHYTIKSMTTNPKRYGGDDGDLNLINDYYDSQDWSPFTREQLRAVANMLRRRNDFLRDNEAYDHRKKNKIKRGKR